MVKAEVISIGENADVTLKSETALFLSIKKFLQDPNSKGIIDKRKKKYMHKEYSKNKVKDFLAPLDNDWGQLYRITIVDKFRFPDAERSVK